MRFMRFIGPTFVERAVRAENRADLRHGRTFGGDGG
jgi:hypothetical protein